MVVAATRVEEEATKVEEDMAAVAVGVMVVEDTAAEAKVVCYIS